MTDRTSRRQVLEHLLAIPPGLALGGCVTAHQSSGRKRALGLADLTVAKALAEDYAGTVQSVAAMGYTHFGFRLAGYAPKSTSELSPERKAHLVRSAGMEVGVVRYGYGESFASQAAAAQAIGAKVIAYSAAPVFFRSGKLGVTTRAAFEAWLPELGQMAAIARDHGLILAYHNHWWDHEPLEGVKPLDRIAEVYSPAEVSFEIDLAWAFIGKADPLALVRSLGPRVVSMHFKDVDAARGTDPMKQLVEPGAGGMDYAALLPALDRTTEAIGYVEVDAPADGMAAARSAAAFIDSVRRAR